MRIFWKRLSAFVVCFAVLLASQASFALAKDDSYKDEINDLNSHIAALKEEQKKLDAEISKTKNDKAALQKQREQLQNQIYLAQQEIELLGRRIDSLEDTISQKQVTIGEKEKEIDKNYDAYKMRLRAMYMRDNATTIGVVLGADSYSDMLAGAEMTRRISQSDQILIDNLVKAKREMEEALAEVEAAKAQVEADKRDMAAQQQSLSVKKDEVAKQEQDLAQLQKEFEAQKAQKLKEEKEAQAEIDRIYRENASIGDYVGGDFKWPVTGYTTITSAFGWRFGGTDYHTGVDIAGRNYAGQAIYRQPIRAANEGSVIYASNSYTPGRGYGRYIIVDHGGGMSTLYGHSDEVIVKKGDYVQQGQTLGYVGTTGWSTGPHLHFEIRVNGTPKNPMSYFS